MLPRPGTVSVPATGAVRNVTSLASVPRKESARARMSPEFHSASTVRFWVSAVSVRVSLTGFRMVPLASIFFIIARRKFCWRAMRSKSPFCRP